MFRNNLLRNILFVSFISVLLLAAYNLFFVFPSFKNLIAGVSEDDAVRTATHLANRLLARDLQFTGQAVPQAFIRESERVRRDFGLMKVLVFSSSGEVLYSSDPADVGRVTQERFFHEVVAKGKVYRELVRKGSPSVSGQEFGKDAIEAYVPLLRNGRFLGACEVYMDITEIKAKSDMLLLRSLIALLVLVGGLLAAFFIASLRADRSLLAQRKAEEALRESELFLQTVIETEPECVKLLARDGTLLRMNRAGLEMIGADSFASVKGESVYSLISPEYREAFKCLTEKTFEGKPGKLEFEMTGLEGKRLWLETHAVPIRDAKGEIFASLGITRNITDRKKAEEEAKRRARQLEESYGELESFSYAVSHDLREPLVIIQWFCGNMLKRHGETLDDDGRETLVMIREKAGQMSQLISDLLSFSRVGTKEVRKSDIDMEALAREAFGGLKASLDGRSLTFETGALPTAWGDPSLIRQVVVNLLSNAVKYTRNNAAARIEISGFQEADQNVYCIRDNGIGFDAHDQDVLFGLFRRLAQPQEFEGTGVGLVIAKKIIEKHGGRIWAEGKPNEGAAFYFSLPARESPPGAEPAVG